MKKYLVLLARLCFVAVFIGTAASCHKDEDTVAVITVVDTTGKPVTSATVTLWQDTAINPNTGAQANVRVTKLTGSAGTAEFIFALEAYLNIDASKGSLSGQAFVRLKQEESVSQTVVIR